ncbi:MAG TPA: serine hydrolase domain-containing protein [Acidimicrobiales bacterium]|nr:serine hydrolase domain-containing protein [Acidimicrobiales bacterium]
MPAAATLTDAYARRLEDLLAELGTGLGVPGAVCGVLSGDRTTVATWGVANTATGVEVTPDTLFQLGSLSKLYTTTLLLQAQAAGLVSLDEPVRAQLQEFSVADPGATIEITLRHLVTHTSGIEGDHLIDTGWNGDALKRYVATLAGLSQIHPPEEMYSFCNTGFGVAGRLLEVATGDHFDRVLRRRLARPLGCNATLTLPQHALLHRVAAGHVQAPGGAATRQQRWSLARSNGPMGGVMAPATELLTFARLHVEEGRGPDGSDLLAPAAIAEMQEPQVESPFPGEEQALGWTVRRWGPLTCVGQDADTIGQRAFLRVVPERRFALCVLTNSPTGAALARTIIPSVAADLLDVDASPIAAPTPGPAVPDPGRLSGHYDRLHQRVEVTVDAETGGLVARTEPSGVLGALGIEPMRLGLRPLDPEAGTYLALDPRTGVDEVVAFASADGPDTTGIYIDGRLHRRI